MTYKNLYIFLSVVGLCILLLGRCTPPTNIGGLTANITEHVASQDGDTLKVIITSNEDWKATTNDSWLQPNMDQGIANGRVKLTIKVQPNLTNKDRVGTVSIATSSSSISIKVTQLHGDVDAERYQYNIPVIFHVLYNKEYEKELVADNKPAEGLEYFPLNSSTLQEIIEEVNKIYEGMPKEPQDWGFFRHAAYGHRPFLNLNLKFSLATKDPSGKTLNPIGIVRHEINEREVDPILVMNDKKGGVYHTMSYPVTDYVNVFIFPFATKGDSNYVTLGIAHLPYGTTNNQIAGLKNFDKRVSKFDSYNHCAVINAKVFEPLMQRRLPLQSRAPIQTIAHELGHIVGLFHVFSEKKDDSGVLTNNEQNTCEDTDYCSDTPSYNRYKYEENNKIIIRSGIGALNREQISGLLNRFTCAQQNILSTNVMDYDWTYGDRFELQQKERVRQVLYYSMCIPGLKLVDPPHATRSDMEPTPVVSTCRSTILK